MRKIILFTLAFSFISLLCNSQITKGSTLLGGNFSFSSTRSENSSFPNNSEKHQTFQFSPSVGIAIRQNTIVGAGLTFSRSTASHSSEFQETSYYGINSFVRKYLSLGKNFYLFGEGSLGYIRGEQKIKQNSTVQSESNSNNVSLSIYPGLAYAINKWLHLEAGLPNLLYIGYGDTHGKNTSNPNSSYSSKVFSAGTSLSGETPFSVGFRFIIAK